MDGSSKRAILQPDNNILLIGDFTTYNGISRNGIARVKSSLNSVMPGYKVECLYSTDNTTFTADDTCTKTMVVRASTTGNEVQGCARITNSFENFVGYEKWIHTTGFNASISCIARKSDPEVAEGISPFLIQYGSTFTTL